ncbi:hypothetical protein B5E58_12785, partial [Tyzzerella sp. An114]|uniref:hypothetical protein n=1 Tax=Tyzzerella sp. An114 TaxID=1965545 RepID=UPI000B572D4A
KLWNLSHKRNVITGVLTKSDGIKLFSLFPDAIITVAENISSEKILINKTKKQYKTEEVKSTPSIIDQESSKNSNEIINNISDINNTKIKSNNLVYILFFMIFVFIIGVIIYFLK